MAVSPIKLCVVGVLLINSLHASLITAARDVEPNYLEYAKMARYLVHKLDWTAIATISSNPDLQGYPMTNVKSFADSVLGEKSTGEIYMLLTDLDVSGKDLNVDNRLSALFTMAQYKNCIDPMEPTCARLIISGKLKKIDEDSDEHDLGMNAMLSRHPAANAWIQNHGFYLAKIDIEYLLIVDFYGGGHVLTKEEYFAAVPSTIAHRKSYRRPGRRLLFPRMRFPQPAASGNVNMRI